ncbi:MAG: carboxypeptidase regulatory-like domain-containing protein [Blastocatellia bacterium]
MRGHKFTSLAGMCLLLLASAAFAQSSTATLNGTVSDETGAVIADAMITVTSAATGQTRTTNSNSAGFYTFPLLKPGAYRLRVERSGFTPAQREDVLLQVGDTVALDLSLKVGGVGETVQVTASAAPMLETGSSSLGEVVNSRTIESLPLNGRNVMQLVALTPGISTTPGYRTSTIGSGAIPSNGFSANGGRNVANEIMVDGSPQVVMGFNQPAYVPNPDATQEFKVQTNGLSAEYGRTGGAVVNLVTRSGTNGFHGALWEFVRNDLFDANNFFDNLNNRDKAAFRFNQFGGTAGGPVYLPKFGVGGESLYSGKNRTFFFFSYEGVRQVSAPPRYFHCADPEDAAGRFLGNAGRAAMRQRGERHRRVRRRVQQSLLRHRHGGQSPAGARRNDLRSGDD